jgi:hypothetical protein
MRRALAAAYVGASLRAHAMAMQGERITGFILIPGLGGIRYAVRQHAVSIIRDADECHDETTG